MSGRYGWVLILTLSQAPARPGTATARVQEGAGAARAAAPMAVLFGARVTPDTVTVGAPFRVVLRVRAPRGAAVSFPDGPDSGAAVEALDPRETARTRDSSVVDVQATYRLAAWEVGPQAIALAPIVVRIPGGEARSIVPHLLVVVASTVPAGGAGRIPRAARAFYPDVGAWWWSLALALAVLVVVALAWWLAARARNRRRRPPPAPSALDRAAREFADLDRLGLLEAGETGRYVALTAEIVRAYLARRLPVAVLASTTAELLESLRGDPRVPTVRLRSLLADIDLVKFAARTTTADHARTLAQLARALVTEIDAAVYAAEVEAREAAARQAAREFDERRAARAAGRGRAA